MKNTTPVAPKIETRTVRHDFTVEEIAGLNIEFRQSYDDLRAVIADADSQKSVWKSKEKQAQSRMENLSARIGAGFDMRDTRCRVEYFPKERKKKFFLEDADAKALPVHIEDMSAADYDQELIQAEAAFELREEVPLFPTVGNDRGVLVVGRLKGKWYTALRVVVGSRKIEERLDSEQKAVKNRFDAVTTAAWRAFEWLSTNLGKDAAKGFEEPIRAVIDAHKERVE